jgi:hypothetical protein
MVGSRSRRMRRVACGAASGAMIDAAAPRPCRIPRCRHRTTPRPCRIPRRCVASRGAASVSPPAAPRPARTPLPASRNCLRPVGRHVGGSARRAARRSARATIEPADPGDARKRPRGTAGGSGQQQCSCRQQRHAERAAVPMSVTAWCASWPSFSCSGHGG